MKNQQNAYEWKISELSKPIPKNIDELYEDSLKNQINILQQRLERITSERNQFERDLADLNGKLDMIYSDAIFETLPEMSRFCSQMKKYLNKQEIHNSQKIKELFSFQSIMNFDDVNKNKYLLKDKLKKTKETQTDDDRDKLPKDIYDYMQQEILAAGKPQLRCLFDQFDSNSLREYQKDKIMEKTKFTDTVNTLILSYVDLYHKKHIQFKTHCYNYLIDLQSDSNKQQVMKTILHLFNTSHEYSDIKSRYQNINNYFAAKIFNQIVCRDQRKPIQPIIHDQLICQFMKDIQTVKQENAFDYQICIDQDINNFIQYNYLFKALKNTFTSQRINTIVSDFHKKFFGQFFEFIIIQEAFGYNQSEQYMYREKTDFLYIDKLYEQITLNKSKLISMAKDRVQYVIEKETDIFKSHKIYLRRKKTKLPNSSPQSLLKYMETALEQRLIDKIEEVDDHQQQDQSPKQPIQIDINTEQLDNDMLILKQYYELLIIKIMIFDEKHMPRTIRKLFKQYGNPGHKEELTKDQIQELLCQSFEGYITDFEIEFLLIFLAVNQIEKGDLNNEEKYEVMQYLTSNFQTTKDSEKQKTTEAQFNDNNLKKVSSTSLTTNTKMLRPYFLKHLQRDLHFVEDQKILQNEMTNKYRVFNAFFLALTSDIKYYAYDRFNNHFKLFDKCEKDLEDVKIHKMHYYDSFRQFINEYIFDDGGQMTYLNYQQKQDLTYNLYLKMCNYDKFDQNNLERFNKETLIQILIELRVFTGFQLFIDEIKSPLFSKNSNLKLKRKKSKKKSGTATVEKLNNNIVKSDEISRISNDTIQTNSAFAFAENEIIKKITLNFQNKIKKPNQK